MGAVHGVVVAFDFGFRRIGIAVGNPFTKGATPLPTVLAQQGEPCEWGQIEKILREWRPAALIVGLPIHLDGSEQYTTRAAKAFAATLQARFQLPVHLVDERLSTVEARAQLFEIGGSKKIRKSAVDSMAACVILEQWLKQSDAL